MSMLGPFVHPLVHTDLFVCGHDRLRFKVSRTASYGGQMASGASDGTRGAHLRAESTVLVGRLREQCVASHEQQVVRRCELCHELAPKHCLALCGINGG